MPFLSPRSSLPLCRAVPSEFQHAGVPLTRGSTEWEGKPSELVSSGKWGSFQFHTALHCPWEALKKVFLDWRFFSSAMASSSHFCRGQLFIDDTVLPPRHRQPCLPLSAGLEPSEAHLGFLETVTECLCGPDSEAILLHPLSVAHSLRAVSSTQSHQ